MGDVIGPADGSSAGVASGGRPALRRDVESGVVAGVCAGLARWLGIDPLVVRVAFVAAAAAGGMGVALYVLAWALMPAAPSQPRLAARPRRRRGGWQVASGVGLLALSLLLVLRELGVWFTDALVWPLVLAAAGAALIWHQSTAPAEPSSESRRAGGGPSLPGLRAPSLGPAALGAALVLGAALLFLLANDAVAAARDIVLTTVVVVLALTLILTPFWWRLVKSLTAERAERIRSQERAELSAHLHDSVLQTLALVQRRADDSRAVAALARRQERELRAWLSGKPVRHAGESLIAALEAAAAEIEELHGVTVDVVAVGDCPLDERGQAVVGAAREALVNAAKFAGEEPIAVYAEVGEEQVRVFVRDRGPGFDLNAVPDSRRGIRESIVARLERQGGRAAITADGGMGTEVELVVDRAPA